MKVGLVRLITLWPFPRRALEAVTKKVTKLIVPEMNMGQMYREVVRVNAGRATVVKVTRIDGELMTPQEIADAISKSEFIVSTRMHAIILGTLSRTPFFAVGDSHKFTGVLGPLCDGCVMDIDDFDENSVETIIQSIKNRESLRKSISANFPQVRKRAMENAGIILGKLREWGFA